jgi:competence protein ComEC
LEELRAGGDTVLWRHLRHERSGLAAALLLGAREELDAERTEAFFETGTVHILAISGMHIAILAGSLFYGLRLGILPRRGALAAVVAVTLAYTVLTDSEPSALRAWFLVLLVCVAQITGRRTSAANCLAAAALFVLALNPAELFHVGAQLSFLAVAVPIAFGEAWANRPPPDPLRRLILATRPWPARWSRGASIAVGRLTLAGLAVWLVELPLVMAEFHLLSPAAVVLTTLSWLPVMAAMLAGFGVLVFGWLLPPLGAACGWLCDVNLAALDWMVGTAAPLPASHFWVPGPDAWWLAGFYGALLLWWWAPAWRPPRRWCLALLAGWIAIGLAGPTLSRAKGPDGDAQLRATFISVGHGLSVCLELPDGRTLLYDAGSLGSPKRAAESVAGLLWSRGITHLDAVVVSHADVDHYNAMPELIKRFSVGVVYVSPVMFDESTPALEVLQAALAEHDVPIHTLHGGQRLRAAGDLRIEVLHPPRRGMIGSDNSNSVVLAIANGERRILLTGDLESPGLEALLEEEPYDCDILLAPHHGSGLSDPPGMAAWSSPEWVVISGSHGFDSAAVERAYRTRGARVLHTARDGAVEVTIDDQRLTISLASVRAR